MNLLHEQINSLAKELRLTNLTDIRDACAREAVVKQLSYGDFLCNVLRREVSLKPLTASILPCLPDLEHK